MKLQTILPALIFSTTIISVPPAAALAASCLNGSCHQELTTMKHMHGPIGAEMAGVQGCIMCHLPAGVACTPAGAGKFTFKVKDMCLTCHVKGSSSRHANATSNCLQCHNPHGSNTSPYMLRGKS